MAFYMQNSVTTLNEESCKQVLAILVNGLSLDYSVHVSIIGFMVLISSY